jgi:hypothetical protein
LILERVVFSNKDLTEIDFMVKEAPLFIWSNQFISERPKILSEFGPPKAGHRQALTTFSKKENERDEDGLRQPQVW